jgi:alkanesulfonate monooxygenase SsuD/methylene tetrahydromethanopterin reductase-like flavin-dependent oxidoreductase (luciferase family)
MTKVQFGLVVPGDALEKSRRPRYMEDVNRLLNSVKGSYTSAWFIDHLQFEDSDVLEGWTALTYLSALHPELQWGNSVLCQSFRLARISSVLPRSSLSRCSHSSSWV